MKKTFAALLSLMLATSCVPTSQIDALVGSRADSGGTDSPSEPSSDLILLQIYGTAVKTGYAGTTFASPLKVLLLKNGLPFGSESISFTITSGTGGSLSESTVATDSNGFASVFFTASATPQNYEISASWNSGARQTAFTAISTSSPEDSASKIIKILEAGAGSTPEVGSATVDLNSGTLSVKAALFDFTTNTYISDVAVSWAAVGGGFNSSDFSTSVTNTTSAIFRPSRSGSTLIQATYVGGDATVIGPVDTTGTITVTQTLVPGIIQRISGNNQTQVANDVLTDPLKVRILTSDGVPIPGLGVNFAAVVGSGTIITPQPALTDANGYATSIVQFSTLPGTYSFTATVVADTSLNIAFTENATVGAPDHLAFSTQPGGANAGNPFTQQPVVLIKDAFNNTITGVPTSVTVALSSGTGVLSGTKTITSSGGFVSFTDLSYSIAESGVTLLASASGLTSASSSSFTVSAFLGSCSVNDSGWTSTEGGCKDATSGLVWNTVSSISYTWYESVWDNAVGSTSDINDYGRTNDYESGVGCPGSCDISTTDYCKNLSYNGYSDWRLPALSDLSTAYTHGAATHLSDIANVNVWSSTTGVPFSSAKVINLSTGATTTAAKSNLLKTYCVRGGWSNPARVTIVSLANWIKINQKKHGAKLRLLDGNGARVNGRGITVGLSTDTGSVTGTVTASTDAIGEASLSEWQIDTLGSQIMTATSSGLLPAVQTVTGVSAFGHNCAIDNNRFATADGGCKDLSTGNVWSPISSTIMIWFDFIWDSLLTGNAVVDAFDSSRTNDYAHGIANSWGDSSAANYCHGLNNGGAQDWRAPTYEEMATVMGTDLSGTYFGSTYNSWIWTASTDFSNGSFAMVMRMTDGVKSSDWKNTSSGGQKAICVRQSPLDNYVPSKGCLVNDSNFTTALGGCKDSSTGLVWSRGTNIMRWYEAIWDSTVTPSDPADGNDFGTTNDYEGGSLPAGGYGDGSSLINYCHALVEGGYSDWRMPTLSELSAVSGASKAGNHFSGAISMNSWYWTSTTYSANGAFADIVNLSTSATGADWKNTSSAGQAVICVRDPSRL